MTIAYYTTAPFPDGGMATGNRILHLAKSLKQESCDVLVCAPFSDSGRRESIDVDGVCFHSLCTRKGYFATRFGFYILFPVRFFRLLRRIDDTDRILYEYQPNLWLMVCAHIISRLLRIPLFREGTEFPYTVLRNAVKWKQCWELALVRKCSGVVAITENLAAYYKAHLANGNVIQIPMTVDCERFDKEDRPSPFDFEYIAYTGSMSRSGGGVDVLVRTFAEIEKIDKKVHLVLIGRGSESLKQELLTLGNATCRDKIHFLFGGNIPSSDMPRYIKNAKLLAMLPLPTRQQEGCFPTKLGEYLASGIPCVVSNVGVPPKFLTDKVNVRFVPPGDVLATAQVMIEMLANCDVAHEVAARGKKYAREHFHYANFGSRLANWLKGDVDAR